MTNKLVTGMTEPDKIKQQHDIINNALADLIKQANELVGLLSSPLYSKLKIRPRTFIIASNNDQSVVWPRCNSGGVWTPGHTHIMSLVKDGREINYYSISNTLNAGRNPAYANHISVPYTCPIDRSNWITISPHAIVSNNNGNYFNNTYPDQLSSEYSYHSFKHTDLSDVIATICAYQPRPIIRSVRRIQSATAWCADRIAGIRRSIYTVIQQQIKSQKLLDCEELAAIWSR